MAGFAASGNGGASAALKQADQIVFFDVETTIPWCRGQKHELLEFAAVVVAVHGFYVLDSYSTFIRPKTVGTITKRSIDCNGITAEDVANAPTFECVADRIYGLLHGRIWAGHNILKFDNIRIGEAFNGINRPCPQSVGVIDTLPLLRNTFGRRAGDLKMASLAKYCGLGEQKHRSLADVEMNLEVLKHCATTLFLESNFPAIFKAVPENNSSPAMRKSFGGLENLEMQEPNATVGNDLPLSKEGEILEGSIETSIFTRQTVVCGDPLISEDNIASSSYQLVSTYTPQSCGWSNGIVEHVDVFEACRPSTLTEQRDYSAAFDLSTLSCTLESICNEKELQKQAGFSNNRQELGHSLNIDFSSPSLCQPDASIIAGCESATGTVQIKERCRKDNLETEINTLPCTSDSTEVTFWDAHDHLESLQSSSSSEIDTPTGSIGCHNSFNGSSCTKYMQHAELNVSSPRDHESKPYGGVGSRFLRWLPLHSLEISRIDADVTESSDILQEDCVVLPNRDDFISSSTDKSCEATESLRWEVFFDNPMFVEASQICLEALGIKKEPGFWGRPKIVLYHKGIPLRMREVNIRVKFAINASYAFDNKGKARFSIMLEPCRAACEVICRCDNLVRNAIATEGEQSVWRPTLVTEEGVSGVRMRIGTKGSGESATYTTEFYRHISPGIKKLVLQAVDTETMKTLLPRGSFIDVAYTFDVYSINGTSGIQLVANRILLR